MFFDVHTRDDSLRWVQNFSPQKLFFCRALFTIPSQEQTHRAKQLTMLQKRLQTPQIVLISLNFCPKTPIEHKKNPSGIVSIPDGFHGGSRRIRTIDLPGMKCRKLIPDDNYTVIFHHKTLRYFKACLGVSMSIHFLNSIPKLFNP